MNDGPLTVPDVFHFLDEALRAGSLLIAAMIVFPMAIWLGVTLGGKVIRALTESLNGFEQETKEKAKYQPIENPFETDETPIYMTIGDDGELVEVDGES